MVAVNESISPVSNAGRPTKYRPNFCKPARKLSELGATEIEIAEYLDVNHSTLNTWMNEHPEFHKAVKETKEIADNQVVRGLYKRATGFSKMVKVVGFSKDGEMIESEEEKYFPPSEVACIFWLKNRRPKEWRDKIDTTISNSDGTNIMDALALMIAQKIAQGTMKEIQDVAIDVKQVEDVK